MVDIAPSKDFAQQLRHLWWRLDRAIDLPILEASALAGCADAAHVGVTSVVDHHAGPEAIDGSLSVIRKAYEEIGMRGLLCYETTDRNGMEGARAGIAREPALRPRNRRRCEAARGARAAATAPRRRRDRRATRASRWARRPWRPSATRSRSSKRGLHIHAGEDKFDAVDSRYRFGADLAARLDAAGCLGPKTIIGHGVWLGEAEADLLNARGSFLAHNARSNMNNAVGYNALLPRFANVVLGTDGMSADMLEEFRFACFRHREAGGPWWPGEFLRCLDRGNRLMERYMGMAFGRVVAGRGRGPRALGLRSADALGRRQYRRAHRLRPLVPVGQVGHGQRRLRRRGPRAGLRRRGHSGQGPGRDPAALEKNGRKR